MNIKILVAAHKKYSMPKEVCIYQYMLDVKEKKIWDI